MLPSSQQRAASPPAGGHGDSDPVTRLPSRRQFLDLLGEEIEGLGAGNGSLAVQLVDLDGFRRINRDRGLVARVFPSPIEPAVESHDRGT